MDAWPHRTTESGTAMYNYPPPGYLPPGYPPYGHSPPPRKRLVWPWVLGGAAILFVIAVGVVAVLLFADTSSDRVKITYSVEGTANSVDITYTGSDNGEKTEHVSLPWTKEVTVGSKVVFVSLMANSVDLESTVRCRIVADGKEVASNGPTQMMAACFGSTGNKWSPG